jgi:hypothetical protein
MIASLVIPTGSEMLKILKERPFVKHQRGSERNNEGSSLYVLFFRVCYRVGSELMMVEEFFTAPSHWVVQGDIAVMRNKKSQKQT